MFDKANNSLDGNPEPELVRAKTEEPVFSPTGSDSSFSMGSLQYQAKPIKGP